MSDFVDKIKNLTPEQLELLRKKMSAKAPAKMASARITRREDQSHFPMTAAQKRLWFLQQLDSSSAFYSIPSAVRIRGSLNVEAMEQAIQRIVQRHDVLRSYYTASPSGEAQQSVEPSLTLPLTLVDLTNTPKEQKETETRSLLTQIALTPFDLTKAPLLSAALIKRQQDDFVLMLNLHHIIADGWTIGILLNEIMTSYRAIAAPKMDPLAEPSLQFADYAAWLEKQATDENLNRQLGYWNEYLQGMPANLDLITDYQRPAIQSHQGRHIKFQIPQHVVDAFRQQSRAHNTSLYNILMAATQLFLFKYTQQKDFGIGAPIANRNRKDVEEIVGFFVNTVVLRAEFKEDMTFDELIERVRQHILSATENQDVPFERIVESLAPQRDLSRSPLFQVMFDLQQTPFSSVNLDQLTMDIYDFDIQISTFDMLFLLLDDGAQIQGTLEYNSELFRETTVAQCAFYYQTLLSQLAEAPTKRISELSLLRPEQERQMISDWNATQTEYPRDKTLVSLFEQAVEIFPQAVAVSDPVESVTYKELNERANRLSHYLIANGVLTGSNVGIYMERSVETIIAVLAVIKAGACYVPLDLAYPVPRLAFMLQDTQAGIIITQSSLKDKLPAEQFKLILLDDHRQSIEKQKAGNPPDSASPQSPAYIIYTSGSTGQPKGVVVPHRAIVRLVKNTNYIDLTPDQIIAQVSNSAFDAATLEIWGALLNGAKLVIFPKDILLSSRTFVEQLKEHRISAMFLTVAYFNQIAREFPGAFKSVQYCMFGGEAADAATVRHVLDNDPPPSLINAYGPTENTTFSNCYEIHRVDDHSNNVPIGKPIANSTCYVLDEHLHICPPGVPGELFVGGDGLALGYHNRPELNAERFVANPFKTWDDRLYRTGDLVRYLPDGNIEFLARIDQQVKIRGFRIELGEIEVQLKQSSGIADAVVLARENKLGEKQLVAYVVPAAQTDIDVDAIRTVLAEKLPDYMIPAFIIKIKAVPLNANGKVDKQALPDPAVDQLLNRTSDYVAPRTPLETYLVSIWQEILGLERIGVYDHFFEIGGNSLKAAMLVNRLQSELHEDVHVASVFKAPRIAEFALYAAEYYGQAISERFGKDAVIKVADSRFIDTGASGKIDSRQVEDFRRIISPLAPSPKPFKTKNPRAIFVLSPPRSGSTLLRVMLAGNQRLFSPPELDLLSFNTLQERRSAFSEPGLEIWLQAPIRAIMELLNLDADGAAQIISDLETRDLSVKEFYREMQTWLGDRILVDKTPTYPFDPHILSRAEADFEDALYIHLVRHPYAMIYSFMEAKLDENFFRYQHSFTRRQLAELIWIVSNQNILTFFKSVPAERQYRIHFENLLHNPEGELRDLCDFMQVEFQSEMLEPYKGKKMTDGINKNAQMVGDFKFYLHKSINVDVAERWRQVHSEDFLSDMAWNVAQELGYEPERELSSSRQKREKLAEITIQSRDGQLPLSFAQQRLWFLDQFEPGNPQYNVPVAVYLKGRLDREKLTASLNLIIRRHETLRTTFEISEDGRALQVIHSYHPVKLPFISLLELDEQERAHEVQKIANAEASRQFDLRLGPLIRMRLIQTAADEFVLVLVMHHIISDGWSANILIRELTTGYEHLCRDEEPVLTELPVQYADFAVWQRQWLSGERLDKQLAYWKQKLDDLPALLELPTDRPRTTVSAHRGKEIIFRFSQTLTQELKTAAKSHGVTDFMLLLAGFQVLLARYSNQKDVAVGTPIAGRTRREIEPLIGFFVNTLVMRGDLDGNPTFAEFLSQVKKTAVEAYEHQDVPFEKLVDLLQPQRDTSHAPLFQVMFALQESSLESIDLTDLRLSVFQISSGAAKFDMSLSMVERDGQFRGQLEYDSDLFDSRTIEQFIHHFRLLFESIATNQNQRVFDVDILSEHDRATIIHEFNDVGAFSIPDDALLYDLFEKRAARSPHQVVVLSESGALTCDQLNKRANQLALYLVQRGLGAEKFAAICMDRSAEMIVGILGILKAGAAYVPMDPDYPAERLSYILNDSRAGILLTQKHLLDKLPETSAEIICLDEDWDAISHENDGHVRRAISSRNLAYMIYTSGSTGKPKGVTITHRSATALVSWGIENYRPEQVNGFFFSTSICFDVSVFEIFVTICGHGRLVIGKNALDLPNMAHRDQVTLVSTVPSAISQLMRMEAIPASVTTVHLAGEFLSPAIVDQLYQRKHILTVYDLYGPTEDTVYSTHALRQKNAPATIGKPLKGKRIYVLDAAMNPVPVGVPGEMFIGGIGLARGYHQQPELTAEKFIPDPFSQTGGERIYRTGDLVRYHHDGTIEYLGRIDHQVKIRGYRIELGEIETTLRRFPQIRDVAVVVYEEIPGDKRLVAYYTFQTEKPTVEALRAFLQEGLPEYMVPSYFVSMEELPRTPNGKLNRKALPKPHIERSDLSSVYSAANSDVEKLLSQIWQDVLNVDQVGIDDNFFALGGDSILSIQVLARARQHGFFVSPKEFFNQPTIRGLALVAGDVHRIEAEQGRVVGEAPVSSIQRSFFAQNLTQRHHWNQSLLLDVHELLDPAALQAAVEALLAHHDMLRSRFVEEENEWIQRIPENIDQMPLHIYNLETSDESEQKAFIEKVMAEQQSALNIYSGPICRFICINLPQQSRWRLGMIIHHLAVDGVSWRILLEDLQSAYDQSRNGSVISLPDKTTSYPHWAKRAAEKRVAETEVSSWFSFADAGIEPYPVDRAEASNLEGTVRLATIRLSENDTQALVQMSQKLNVRFHEMLIASTAYALTRWSGNEWAVFDLEGHGREIQDQGIDVSRTVGWFTTIFPVYLHIDSRLNSKDLAKDVSEQLIPFIEHGAGFQFARFPRIEDGLSRRLEKLARPSVSFNYLGQFDGLLKDQRFRIATENTGFERHPENLRSYEIDLSARLVNGQLSIDIAYSNARYLESTIAQLAELIREMLADLSQSSLTSAEEMTMKAIGVSADDVANVLDEMGLE